MNVVFEQQLKTLIKTASVSSTEAQWDMSNTQVVELLRTWLEEMGAKVTVMPLPTDPNKQNLLAKFSNDNCSDEGGLLFTGHTDTVPFDETKWRYPPLELHYEYGRYYGVGTTDMKGFVALVLEVLRNTDLQKITKPIYFLATCDEESTMEGAQVFAEQIKQDTSFNPEVAIIGEPTDLQPVYAHKGHMSKRISIYGKGGHSSRPDIHTNTISCSHSIIGKLLEQKESIKHTFPDSTFSVPYPTMNLGAIHGGDSANRICSQCHIDFDVRLTPNVDEKEFDLQLQSVIENDDREIDIKLQDLHAPLPAHQVTDNSPYITLLEEMTGQSCVAMNYATEAPFIQSIGVDTFVLGPGSIDQAHQSDEYIEVTQLQKMKKILDALIANVCMQAEVEKTECSVA